VASDPLVELAERLQGISLGRGLTVGAAESCTGGLVARTITTVPGASGYFKGSIVAYADDVKAALLGVPLEVLSAHGAVSAQVARAMAAGARERLGVDLAVAITGVAGPAGGTDEKPVGLTYVAIADGTDVDVQRHQWTGDREANIRDSGRVALELLLERAEARTATAVG
jgi:PncC family amidohydrolase